MLLVALRADLPCLIRSTGRLGSVTWTTVVIPRPNRLFLPGQVTFDVPRVWSDPYEHICASFEVKRPENIFTMPEIETLDDEVFFCLICNSFSFVFGNFFSLPSSYERLSVNIDQNRLFVAQVQNSNFAHFWLIDNP